MNKKGFTMIELLATIVILGILMALVYTSVSKYLSQALDTTYSGFEENIENGVANYLIDHSGYIPDEGESLVVDVDKLVCEGYVESLEDPSRTGKTCNLESYVIVKRNNDTSSNMDLSYEACLVCSNYKSPFCSNSIAGIKRLTADSDCEVD